ncbi:hypothetical protein [Xanthomonas euvesicatoria]|uniref:hypothetical protein n=1 Tax=Xanthomonas euvesicatoria TaxID=456327 RepID=UPI001C47E8F2|nr:hypothetical protein [Xanthomonas euvesicatoria]MBV6882068.1 hypothetical protein [Xanthomonas campestris pv. euphorbiae]
MSLPVLQAPSVIEQINARLSAWQNRPISFFMRVAGCLGWVGQELAQHSTGQTRQHERTTEGSSRDIGITTGKACCTALWHRKIAPQGTARHFFDSVGLLIQVRRYHVNEP